MFLYGAETLRCPSSTPHATDTRLPLAGEGRGLPIGQLTVRKTRPPLVTVAMTDKTMPLSHYTSCSHAVKNTLQSKEETDNTPTEKTEQVTSNMKQGLRTLSF